MGTPYDIAVLGSGPSALCIASALSARDASVVLIAPQPRARWKPNYCMWADELPAGLAPLVERSWSYASVATSSGKRDFRRTYVKLDTARLQAALFDELREHGVDVVEDVAVDLVHAEDQTQVVAASGSVASARVVVDATGGESSFTRRVHARPPAFQTAYGLELRAPGHGFDLDQMMLMDFRPAPCASNEPPSFLYVLPLDEERVFLEETSLARRPAMPIERLQSRLEARLAQLGLHGCDRLGEERCIIPMGLGLPAGSQDVVPFGVAGAMVHPSSGYLVAHVFRKAGPVAEAILAGLASGGRREALSRGNASLWPPSQRKLWELYGFGLETLVGMNAKEIDSFFHSFFDLPVEGWAGFLAGTQEPATLGAVMTRLFRSLPVLIRWHLVRTGLVAGAAPLARSVLRTGVAG